MSMALIIQTFALIGAMVVVVRLLLGQTEARLDERLDAIEATIDAKFDTVDHRLAALEGDVMLIKQHLLSQRAS